MKSTTSTGAALEFGKQLNVNLSAGAVIDFTGPARYQEALPLRYGDGFALKHNTYGTYLTALGGRNYDAVGKASFGAGASWLAEVGDELLDWGPGNNKLGVQLTSGAYIRMGNFDYFDNTGGDSDYRMYIYGYVALQVAALVSTPCPPYVRARLYDHKSSSCTRIYKYGASVGDPISKGDIVYIYSYYNSTPTDVYLGSANLTTGSDKEVFLYHARPASATIPSGFVTGDLWVIDDVFPNSYQTKPTSGAGHSSAYFPLAYLANWPSVASRQF
jgi:hypothetical protein